MSHQALTALPIIFWKRILQTADTGKKCRGIDMMFITILTRQEHHALGMLQFMWEIQGKSAQGRTLWLFNNFKCVLWKMAVIFCSYLKLTEFRRLMLPDSNSA